MSDISNKAQEVVGSAKEKAGEVTGDDELAAEGRDDQTESKVKQLTDDAKDVAGNIAGRVKDVFKK